VTPTLSRARALRGFNSTLEASNLDEVLGSAIHDVEQAGFAVARVEIERHKVPQSA
jgi:hypothetical protein